MYLLERVYPCDVSGNSRGHFVSDLGWNHLKPDTTQLRAKAMQMGTAGSSYRKLQISYANALLERAPIEEALAQKESGRVFESRLLNSLRDLERVDRFLRTEVSLSLQSCEPLAHLRESCVSVYHRKKSPAPDGQSKVDPRGYEQSV